MKNLNDYGRRKIIDVRHLSNMKVPGLAEPVRMEDGYGGTKVYSLDEEVFDFMDSGLDQSSVEEMDIIDQIRRLLDGR